MNIIRTNKTKAALALVLAALLMLLCWAPLRAQAAGAIDVGKSCQMTITGGSEYSGMKIPVSIYRVASVSSSGQYTAADANAFSGLNFGSITSGAHAADWMALAKSVKERIDQNKIAATKTGTMTKGSITFSGLETGMYLIAPDRTYSGDYSKQYTFTPYLAALPNSAYTTTGTGSDAWRYEIEVGLKAEQTPLTGKLVVTKTLQNYNETLGKTTFVFEITGKDSSGKVVYSNVISTTHSGPGSQSVTIPNLPAGLTITVKEVYSGASYTPVGSASGDAYIYSDEAIQNGAGKPAEVTFTNKYDGGNRGGYGVTNRFQSDGRNGWIWNNPTTPAQQ